MSHRQYPYPTSSWSAVNQFVQVPTNSPSIRVLYTIRYISIYRCSYMIIIYIYVYYPLTTYMYINILYTYLYYSILYIHIPINQGLIKVFFISHMTCLRHQALPAGFADDDFGFHYVEPEAADAPLAQRRETTEARPKHQRRWPRASKS